MSTPTDAIFATVQWEDIPQTKSHPPGSLFATHEGKLTIGDFTFRCYQLNNGQRVFDAEDVEAFFGRKIFEDAE